MTPLKKKYLVETTGNIGKEVYTATDPDAAARLARRAETFFRLIIKKPNMSGEEAIKLADEHADNIDAIPNFRIKKVIEVRNG